jgi:uncharacterized protein YdeI (YjbR/CyaY-like superfamily)
MGKKDPRIDAYMGKSAEFARPILTHLRELVHEACPQVQETMKWNFPHFEHKGVLCSMASFKQHCAFGFWKGEMIFGTQPKSDEAMGQFGRITSLADLPKDKVILGYVREAVRLNEAGVKRPLPERTKGSRPIVVPDYLTAALKKNKKAFTTFEAFSPSHKREYIDWLQEAKREETRQKRLSTAIDWLSKGKIRNWKYVKSSA